MLSTAHRSICLVALAVAVGCAPQARLQPVDIIGGDYILPRLSPDGHRLAFAELVATDSGIGSQALVYDISDAQLDTLLSASASWRFATYSAYPIALRWTSNTQLEVRISDGDVDVSTVQFDLVSRDVASRRVSSDDEEIVPAPIQALADTLAALYPGVSPDSSVSPSAVFASGLVWPHVRGNDAVIMQKRYARVDDHVWIFSTAAPISQMLVSLPEGPRFSMSGGVFFGSDAIFGVGADTVVLFRLRNGAVDSLMTFPARRQNHRLDARASLPTCVWLRFQPNMIDSVPTSVALVYDGRSLTRALEAFQPYDFDVSTAGTYIAISHWVGGVRQMRLLPLSEPCVA